MFVFAICASSSGVGPILTAYCWSVIAEVTDSKCNGDLDSTVARGWQDLTRRPILRSSNLSFGKSLFFFFVSRLLLEGRYLIPVSLQPLRLAPSFPSYMYPSNHLPLQEIDPVLRLQGIREKRCFEECLTCLAVHLAMHPVHPLLGTPRIWKLSIKCSTIFPLH